MGVFVEWMRVEVRVGMVEGRKEGIVKVEGKGRLGLGVH